MPISRLGGGRPSVGGPPDAESLRQGPRVEAEGRLGWRRVRQAVAGLDRRFDDFLLAVPGRRLRSRLVSVLGPQARSRIGLPEGLGEPGKGIAVGGKGGAGADRLQPSPLRGEPRIDPAAESPYSEVADPPYAEVGAVRSERSSSMAGLLDRVSALMGAGAAPEVVEALEGVYEDMRDCVEAPSGPAGGEGDYEAMSAPYENLMAAMDSLVERGLVDQGEYMDMEFYRNVLGSTPEPASEPIYAEVDGPTRQRIDEPIYSEPDAGQGRSLEPARGLLGDVAALMGRGAPPDVVEALEGIYEDMRDCVGRMERVAQESVAQGSEPDYEDMSIIYENLCASLEPLANAGRVDDALYENIVGRGAMFEGLYQNLDG